MVREREEESATPINLGSPHPIAERVIEIIARIGVVTIWAVAILILLLLKPDVAWFSLKMLKFTGLVVGPTLLVHLVWLWILGYEEFVGEFSQKEWFYTFLFMTLMGLTAGIGIWLAWLAVRLLDQWLFNGEIYRSLQL